MADAVTVDEVRAGAHACLTFTDPDERLDLLAAFVGDGLDAGHRVVCFTDAIPPQTLADELAQRSVPSAAAAARGQLRVAECATSWQGGAQQMIDVLGVELAAAAADGYQALRVTADMAWATRPHAAAQELLRFEEQVAALLTDGRLTTICQYDREVFDPVTLAFAAQTHQQAVAAQVYHEDPLLRVCRQYRPPGVRIAGELDYRRRDVLEQALSESIRLDGDVHLNLRRLRYLDATCAAVIVHAAQQLPRTRTMHVQCGRLVDTVLRLSGGVAVGQLRVTVAA